MKPVLLFLLCIILALIPARAFAQVPAAYTQAVSELKATTQRNKEGFTSFSNQFIRDADSVLKKAAQIKRLQPEADKFPDLQKAVLDTEGKLKDGKNSTGAPLSESDRQALEKQLATDQLAMERSSAAKRETALQVEILENMCKGLPHIRSELNSLSNVFSMQVKSLNNNAPALRAAMESSDLQGFHELLPPLLYDVMNQSRAAKSA